MRLKQLLNGTDMVATGMHRWCVSRERSIEGLYPVNWTWSSWRDGQGLFASYVSWPTIVVSVLEEPSLRSVHCDLKG